VERLIDDVEGGIYQGGRLVVAGSLFALRTKDHQGRNTAAAAAVGRKERI
jgi:hypothetical protein